MATETVQWSILDNGELNFLQKLDSKLEKMS